MRLILIALFLTLTSCSSNGIPERLNNRMFVIDGKKYIIKRNIGDTVYINEVKKGEYE